MDLMEDKPFYSDQLKQVLISLEDPLHYLVSTVLAYGAQWAARTGRPIPQQLLNYNYGPYMGQLLSEIFASADEPVGLYEELESTRILVRDGLDADTAKAISAHVFKSILDCVTAAIPTLPFGAQESFQYGLCNEVDLMIMFDIRALEGYDAKSGSTHR
jgi:hypothetical protein